MVQVISISKARSNLSSLVTQVAQTKQPVIIIRESEPVAMINPINKQQVSKEDYLNKLLSMDTSWFTKEVEEEYKQIRRDSKKRAKRLGL